MSGEVRLWLVPGYRPMLDLWTEEPHPEGDGEDDARAYIALPAAEFEAWRRVVEAARARRAFEHGEDGVAMSMAADRARHRELVAAENAAVDALPPEAQQPRQPGREE